MGLKRFVNVRPTPNPAYQAPIFLDDGHFVRWVQTGGDSEWCARELGVNRTVVPIIFSEFNSRQFVGPRPPGT